MSAESDGDPRGRVLDNLAKVPPAERRLAGGLVRRQVAADPRFHQHYEKYGPEGSLWLLEGRALHAYVVGLAIVAIFLIVLDQGRAAFALGVIATAVALLSMARLRRAAVLGRRWRGA